MEDEGSRVQEGCPIVRRCVPRDTVSMLMKFTPTGLLILNRGRIFGRDAGSTINNGESEEKAKGR